MALERLGHTVGAADILFPARPLLSKPPIQVTLVWDDERGSLLGSASGFASPLGTEVWTTGYGLVAPTARQQGIGAALQSAVVQWARAAGCRFFYGFIAEENLASRKMCERAGYVALPVSRSQLRAASTRTESSGSRSGIRLIPSDDDGVVQATITAAGVHPFTALGPPRHSLGPIAPVQTSTAIQRMIRLLRRRPQDTLYRIESTNGGIIGLLVAGTNQHRLVLSRETDLTAPLFTDIERAARDVWHGTPAMGQIAYYHDSVVRPPSELLLSTHRVFALDCNSLPNS
jgi:GNAT superfamily N-acetyltransferase